MSKEKQKKLGIEAIVEPGVGALYVRGTWMKKLDELGKQNARSQEKAARITKHAPPGFSVEASK